MQQLATGLDILQGDKNVYMGFLLPILLSIEQHLRNSLDKLKYTSHLANYLIDHLCHRLVF